MADSKIHHFKIKRAIQLQILTRLNDYVKSFDSKTCDMDELQVRVDSICCIVKTFEEYQGKLEALTVDEDNASMRISFAEMLDNTQDGVKKIFEGLKKTEVTTVDQAQEFYNKMMKEGENIVIEKFPERILHLNELLSMPEFKFSQKSVNRTLDIPALKNSIIDIGAHTLEDRSSQGVRAILEKTLIPSNKLIVDTINIMKPNVKLLLQDANTLKIWLTLLIPKIEDGNNFGVGVQEDTLTDIHCVEVEATSYLENISRYFVQRGKLVAKVLKYPSIEDYWRAIEELDDRQFMTLSLILHEVRNRYTTLRDMVVKNFDKLIKPRTSNMESLY